LIDSYKYVPKKFQDNVEFRLKVRRAASTDTGYQKGLIEACRNDVLFFLNTFAYLYEPRVRKDDKGNKLPKIIPFITWPHQDPVIEQIRRSLGRDERDISVEKSRGEGASWIAVWLAMQDWCLEEMVAIGMVSRNMEAVYKSKDPSSLFWKIDFARQWLPQWMTGKECKKTGWERNLSDHTLINNPRMNSIVGYAATGSVASGSRFDWFFMDELSKFPRPDDEKAMDSTLSVTDSRLIVGTPLGASGAYYTLNHEPNNRLPLRLFWADNITKNRGLYRLVDNHPVAIDPKNNPLLPEYNPPSKFIKTRWEELRQRGFNLETGVRSDWYDRQCHRPRATPQTIAQELDIDYGGSRSQRFGSEFFKAVQLTLQPPKSRGEIHFNAELKPRFDYYENGSLFLWCELDHELRPPKGNYVLGCDIASGFAGTYTANSTIVVLNVDTQEQVAELAVNNIQQPEFADLAMSIAYWFHDAKLGWEANFASGFSERVLEQNYPNLYLRPVLGKKRKRQSTRQEVGWWTDGRKSKPLMFDDLDFFVRDKKVLIRSHAIKDECTKYIVDERRMIEFEGQWGDAAHGDRVIGLGVAVQVMKELTIGSLNSSGEAKKELTPFELRDRDYAKEDRKGEENDWDHTTPAELVGNRYLSFGDEEEFGWV
jgi:hypothetical protein